MKIFSMKNTLPQSNGSMGLQARFKKKKEKKVGVYLSKRKKVGV
jgi:hypothetical protein